MRSTRVFEILLLLLELVVLNGCFFLAVFLRYDDLRIENDLYYNYYLQLLVFLNLSWLLIAVLLRSYRMVAAAPIRASLGVLGQVILVQAAVLGVFILMLKGDYSRLFFFYYASSFLMLIFLNRIGWMEFYRAYLRNPRHQRAIALIGHGPVAQNFLAELTQHPEYGLRLEAWFADENQSHSKFSGAIESASLVGFDEIFVALPATDARLKKLYAAANSGLMRFRYLPDLDVHFLKKAVWENLGGVPVLKTVREPLELVHNRWLKRGLDVVVALLVIFFVMPWLSVLVAVAIKLDSKGPILFKQKRTGLNEKPFWCYKFRSMHTNNPHPEQQATVDDPRITRVGRWLRKYNVDEFPQIFQVLNGKMSLVGPRPHMVEHTAAYRKQIETFMLRHYIKPGLTGLAQIHGFRGPTETLDLMEARVREDVYYMENWSLILDLKILAYTVFLLMKGQEQAV